MMELLTIAIKNWKLVAGGLAMAALGIALTIMTIDRNQWRATARKANAVLVQIPGAQAAALAAAKRAIATKEQQYKDYADEADKTHAASAADDRSATDRYIATHRVPVCPAGGAAGTTAASAQGGGSGLPASVPAHSVVAVSDSDLQACTAAVRYGVDAHNWALGL